MDVKVKAKLRMYYGSYNYEADSLIIDYTFKIKGFKKQSHYIYLESKRSDDSYFQFINRVTKRLESLSHDEVIELTKEQVIGFAKNMIESNNKNDKLETLLKDFNNIKFSFKLKDRL